MSEEHESEEVGGSYTEMVETEALERAQGANTQNAMWFMNYMYFTQVPGGDYSHQGTLNFDVVGYNGDNNIMAPFDCMIKAIYTSEYEGNTVVIESMKLRILGHPAESNMREFMRAR